MDEEGMASNMGRKRVSYHESRGEVDVVAKMTSTRQNMNRDGSTSQKSDTHGQLAGMRDC